MFDLYFKQQEFMKAKYFKILTFLIVVTMVQSYKPCSVIKFDDYSFDLTGLKDLTIASLDKQQYTKIFPCRPQACDLNTTSQKSFILKGGICKPYTINATIFQNFNYINPQSPKTGIKIDYLPYITSNISTNQIIETTYKAQFKIYCSTNVNIRQACNQTTQSTSSMINNNQTKLTKITNYMVCQTSITNGCPFLTVNNFWQFLSDNCAWFAVILWIFSIFQLFMGYFVIRLTLLLYGIQTGAVFGIIFSAQSYQNFYDQTGNGIIIFIIVISFLMGTLFGFVLLTMPRIGYMNIGMWDAIIFSLLLQNSVLYLTGSMLGFYITLGVSSLIMCAISLLRFRKFIILSSPFISAFWIIRTLGFFLPHYPNEFASEKLFAINASTPWQFYLYLVSIIILSVLGCTFQFCWYKKKGRDHGNKGYYLQDDDNIKEKLKKFLQFKDIKNLINAGKEQMKFLKNIVVDRQSSNAQPSAKEKPTEIQMIKISKLKDQEKGKDKERSKEKVQNKEKSKIGSKKKSYIIQNEMDYNRKLKKFDQSEDSDPKQTKQLNKSNNKKSSISIIKSNPTSKFQINNSEKSFNSNPNSDSSSQQEQQVKVQKKIKKKSKK